MKIVIISANIYPAIHPRSFRTTELAVGLANAGHNVTLYALIGKYDYSEFLRNKPNLIIKKLGKSYCGNIDSDYTSKPNVFNRIAEKLLGRIIDYPRCEYIRFTINALKQEENFDYLITIAHPYGCHWGAALYKSFYNSKKFNFWASDCGDPFMGNKMAKHIGLIQKPLEKLWCRKTDKIVIPIEAAKNGYYREFQNKIEVIPQGIDFTSIKLKQYKRNSIPTFFYSGTVYPGTRDPTNLLEYLKTLKKEYRFVVFSTSEIFAKYKEILRGNIVLNNYLPRIELIGIMSTMDFLINIENESTVQLPSKLIDYGLSKRPILSISSTFNDQDKINLCEFLDGKYTSQMLIENIEQYDSANVCHKFIQIKQMYEHNQAFIQ